ncbi:MAG: orotidine-5'-phosphate decarboxylase [Candidatus Magasanikbacteria bacterium]|nr:orotidine-5'-phosphate decarboxylase [Candidatus Magasanikbacteria bacterium]
MMQSRLTANHVVLAADTLTLEQCLRLGPLIGNRVYAVKIHVLWDRHGPSVVNQLKEAGFRRVWVDLKLHDTSDTVALRAKEVAEAGGDIVSVHISGGKRMMQAAKKSGIKVFGITILTSLEEREVMEVYRSDVLQNVMSLALKAKQAGIDGVVCSPREVVVLASWNELAGLKFVTPGVRSPGKEVHDQKRVGTPAKAREDGSNLLVMGRQLTEAEDPVVELDHVEGELSLPS